MGSASPSPYVATLHETSVSGICLHESLSSSLPVAVARSRPRAVLTAVQAIEIYSLRPQFGFGPRSPQSFLHTFGGQTLAVAKSFGVSPKTVRDIWNRRSWAPETRHLWAPGEAAAPPRPRRQIRLGNESGGFDGVKGISSGGLSEMAPAITLARVSSPVSSTVPALPPSLLLPRSRARASGPRVPSPPKPPPPPLPLSKAAERAMIKAESPAPAESERRNECGAEESSCGRSSDAPPGPENTRGPSGGRAAAGQAPAPRGEAKPDAPASHADATAIAAAAAAWAFDPAYEANAAAAAAAAAAAHIRGASADTAGNAAHANDPFHYDWPHW